MPNTLFVNPQGRVESTRRSMPQPYPAGWVEPSAADWDAAVALLAAGKVAVWANGSVREETAQEREARDVAVTSAHAAAVAPYVALILARARMLGWADIPRDRMAVAQRLLVAEQAAQTDALALAKITAASVAFDQFDQLLVAAGGSWAEDVPAVVPPAEGP